MREEEQWCGALLASMPGNEIECNLQKDHEGPHQHVYASAAESELSSLRAEVERLTIENEELSDTCQAYREDKDLDLRIIPERISELEAENQRFRKIILDNNLTLG